MLILRNFRFQERMVKDRKRSPKNLSSPWMLGVSSTSLRIDRRDCCGYSSDQVAAVPWAYHIGGQFFPQYAMDRFWRLHSTPGPDQGLYIQIGGVLWSEQKGTARWKLNPGYAGAASVCGLKGERFMLDLSGARPERLVLAQYRRHEGLANLGPPQGSPGSMRLDLRGEWKGSELVVEDQKPGQPAAATLKPGSYSELKSSAKL